MNSELSSIIHDLNNNLKACYLMLNKINDEENIIGLNQKLIQKLLDQENESNKLISILKDNFKSSIGEFYEEN